jgi:hypothetical protein
MPDFIINDADKQILRDNILEASVHQNENIVRKFLTETIIRIAEYDYPNNWPTLVPSIITNLNSGDNTRMFRSLVPFRYLVKIYELKQPEDRGPLNDLVIHVFPLLLSFAQNLLTNHKTLEAAEFINVILKTYWSSMQLALPHVCKNPNSVLGWMELLNNVMALPLHEASANIPPLGQPIDVEERCKWPWWKCKKWAMKTLARFFNRYGNSKYVAPEFKALSQFFTKSLATTILGTVMNTLAIRPSGGFCPDKVVHSCLTYIETSVEMSVTWKCLRPHLDFLVMKVMFPILAFNDEDQQLWEDDPSEYCRKNFDPMSDFIDPRCACMQLLCALGKLRVQQMMPPFAAFCFQALDAYSKTPVEMRDYRVKDGVLTSFGTLSESLCEKEPYASSIENFLWVHVYPELSSHVHFMRARAAWTIQQFANFEYTDTAKLSAVIQGVIRCMNDPELPVQTQAAVCLQHLIQSEVTGDALKPMIPALLEQYLKLVNTDGNDAVISAFGVLIEKYPDEVMPYAANIIGRMVSAMENFIRQNEGQQDDDDGAALSAYTCLEVIETLVGNVSDKEVDRLRELEPLLVPMMQTLLNPNFPEVLEYFEKMLEFLTFFTFYVDPIRFINLYVCMCIFNYSYMCVCVYSTIVICVYVYIQL